MTMMSTDGPAGRIEYRVSGPAGAPVLLYHSGTPSAAARTRIIEEPAAARGLRTVNYSRPGYGYSAPRPGRTVADAIGEVLAVLEAVGVREFHTLGWSGGGPHALACAALLADRCRGAAIVAGVGPYRRPDGTAPLDFLAGMDEANVTEFSRAIDGRPELTGFLTPVADQFATITPDGVVAGLDSLLSAEDRAALTGDLAEDMAESLRHSSIAGPDGWIDDDLAFVRDWGFDLAAITVPVSIWQGEHDRMVPFAHGRWLAEQVPTARPFLLPAHGHVSLANRIDDILADLLAHSR